MPVFVPEGQPPMPPSQPSPSLNDNLKKVAALIAASLSETAIKPEVLYEAEMAKEQAEEAVALQQAALQNINPYAGGPPMSSEMAQEAGGIIGLAAGGEFSGRVPGNGHGMEDNGTDKQPKEINGLAALKPLVEGV